MANSGHLPVFDVELFFRVAFDQARYNGLVDRAAREEGLELTGSYPTVIFSHSVSKTLGLYTDGKIFIYLDCIFFEVLNHAGIRSAKAARKRLHREIVNTLAHETKHYLLDHKSRVAFQSRRVLAKVSGPLLLSALSVFTAHKAVDMIIAKQLSDRVSFSAFLVLLFLSATFWLLVLRQVASVFEKLSCYLEEKLARSDGARAQGRRAWLECVEVEYTQRIT